MIKCQHIIFIWKNLSFALSQAKDSRIGLSALTIEYMESGVKKVHRFRDTVLVRLDRNLRDDVKGLSERTHETISKIMGWAVEEYMKSVRSQD